MLGGHGTCADDPLGFWMQDIFNLGRNHEDRLGHFPEDVFRPYLRGKFSSDDRLSSYQGYGHFSWKQQYVWPSAHHINSLNEWVTARAPGEADTAFLGRQGDEWDMFLAFIGTVTSQITFQAIHHRQLTNRR